MTPFQSRGYNISLRPQLISLLWVTNAHANFAYNGLITMVEMLWYYHRLNNQY